MNPSLQLEASNKFDLSTVPYCLRPYGSHLVYGDTDSVLLGPDDLWDPRGTDFKNLPLIQSVGRVARQPLVQVDLYDQSSNSSALDEVD